jgi:hypothetical protein
MERRMYLMGLFASMLSACTASTSLGMGRTLRLDPNDPDADLKHKFREIHSFELTVSSMVDLGEFTTSNPVIYRPDGYALAGGGFYGVRPPNPLLLPRSLRLVWYPKGAQATPPSNAQENNRPRFAGPSQFEVTVPVAARIPDELLDDLRRDRKGSLRLKLRIHPDTLLVGWDIQRIPNPLRLTREEILKQRIYLPYAYTHTGGDFKEARSADYVWDGSGFKGLPSDIPAHRPEIHYMRPWRFENLIGLPSAESLGGVVPKVWAEQGLFITSAKDVGGEYREKGELYEKGWYIHPKTGQRIETDF